MVKKGDVDQSKDLSERVVHYKKVAVTDVGRGNLRFSAQSVDDGPKLEKMTAELRDHLAAHPPTAGAYQPRRFVSLASVSVGLVFSVSIQSTRFSLSP